jgi:hypothetical protein
MGRSPAGFLPASKRRNALMAEKQYEHRYVILYRDVDNQKFFICSEDDKDFQHAIQPVTLDIKKALFFTSEEVIGVMSKLQMPNVAPSLRRWEAWLVETSVSVTLRRKSERWGILEKIGKLENKIDRYQKEVEELRREARRRYDGRGSKE